MLAALVALGAWQLHRMQWKAELIEELQIRGSAPAISLPVDSRIPTSDLLYRPVRVTGRFIYDAERHLLNRVRGGTPGINLMTPLLRADGGPTLMVDRGWAPMDWPSRADRADPYEGKEVEVTGIVRRPEPPGWLAGWLRPANRPNKNEWYYVDLAAMAGSVGVLPFVDFYIYATGEAPAVAAPANGEGAAAEEASGKEETRPAPEFPIPNTWQADLPNNHLSYAITWFALAAALLAVYFVYHSRRETGDDLGDGD
jgi:surfeit locus 1 family protein